MSNQQANTSDDDCVIVAFVENTQPIPYPSHPNMVPKTQNFPSSSNGTPGTVPKVAQTTEEMAKMLTSNMVNESHVSIFGRPRQPGPLAPIPVPADAPCLRTKRDELLGQVTGFVINGLIASAQVEQILKTMYGERKYISMEESVRFLETVVAAVAVGSVGPAGPSSALNIKPKLIRKKRKRYSIVKDSRKNGLMNGQPGGTMSASRPAPGSSSQMVPAPRPAPGSSTMEPASLSSFQHELVRRPLFPAPNAPSSVAGSSAEFPTAPASSSPSSSEQASAGKVAFSTDIASRPVTVSTDGLPIQLAPSSQQIPAPRPSPGPAIYPAPSSSLSSQHEPLRRPSFLVPKTASSVAGSSTSTALPIAPASSPSSSEQPPVPKPALPTPDSSPLRLILTAVKPVQMASLSPEPLLPVPSLNPVSGSAPHNQLGQFSSYAEFLETRATIYANLIKKPELTQMAPMAPIPTPSAATATPSRPAAQKKTSRANSVPDMLPAELLNRRREQTKVVAPARRESMDEQDRTPKPLGLQLHPSLQRQSTSTSVTASESSSSSSSPSSSASPSLTEGPEFENTIKEIQEYIKRDNVKEAYRHLTKVNNCLFSFSPTVNGKPVKLAIPQIVKNVPIIRFLRTWAEKRDPKNVPNDFELVKIRNQMKEIQRFMEAKNWVKVVTQLEQSGKVKEPKTPKKKRAHGEPVLSFEENESVFTNFFGAKYRRL